MQKTYSVNMARILALHQAQVAGLLTGKTLQEIGDALGVNKSTISRNLHSIRHLQDQADLFVIQLKKIP